MILNKIVEKIQSFFTGKEELDLTGGPVGINLYHLAVPIVIINLLQTAYNIADTFWLGQYSDPALAAITFAFPLVFFLISLGMGLSVAGNVLVSQLEGSGNTKRRDFAASQTITFSLIASVILGVFGYFFMPSIISLFGAGPIVAAAATSYMQIISLGIFSIFGFAVFMSLMRGFGDVVTPMLIMFGTVIVNIVLDPFLINGWIFFPEMGVAGAAVATIFSRILALSAGLYVLYTGKRGIQIRIRQMRPDLQFFHKMMSIGIPATIGGVGRSVSVNLLVAVVGNLFGQTIVSGYGIGVRMFSLIFLPAMAGGWAVSTMTGQNLGAGKPERAEQAADLAAKYMFLILTGIGIITFTFATPIAAVFTKSPEIAAVGAQFLRFVSLTFGFMGVLRAYTGSLRGAGNTLTAAGISIFALACVRLPVAYIGTIKFFPSSPEAVWLGFAASNLLGGLLALAWYKRGTWKESVIEDRQKGQVAEEAEEYESTIAESADNDLKYKVLNTLETLRVLFHS